MSERFRASRWTSGNRLFPTLIEITDDAVVRRKRRWFSVNETTMHLSRVASVSVETGILWADMRIESSGGGEDIVSHGHSKGDVRRVRELIQDWQTRNAPKPPE